MRRPGPVPWWLAVFALALAARLGFLFVVDEPLLYSHQYNYFFGGLSIVEHPHPWSFVLRHDTWHTWGGEWTMAPLYHLFLAAMFALAGPHLLPVQLVQCLLDGATAVMVGAMARAMAPRRGAWAGVAYALYWPAIEMPSRTLTENVHTPLLMAGITVLVLAAARPAPDSRVAGSRPIAAGLLGGALLGLSALARAVSMGFIPLAAIAHAWASRGWRGRAAAGAAVLAAGAAAILPWSARNAFVIGDPVLIETVGVWNLWTDNSFVTPDKYDRQAWIISRAPTLAQGRAIAVSYALRGIRERPEKFLEKVSESFRHFLRPEGLHQLLIAERPNPAWLHAASLLLDDALLVLSLPFFVVFLFGGGPRLPGRSLLAAWTAYYLFAVVVVFHNEIRYRSAFMPLVFAGAAAGSALLAEGGASRERARAALAGGVGLSLFTLSFFVNPAAKAAAAWWVLRPAQAAIARGDLPEAERVAFLAAQQDWYAARPWIRYGGWMARAGHAAEAVKAYERALLREPRHLVPPLVLPRLLRDLGRTTEADRYERAANAFSRNADPWLALEIAWRELPAPRTDAVPVGREDYGSVRGFLHPQGDHRWTRHLAWVRFVPTFSGDADVVVEMGSPEPSPLPAPEVAVRLDGGPPARFTLSRDVRPYAVRTHLQAGTVTTVELRAPTWNLSGLPAEQGVRVDAVRAVRR